MSSEPAHTVLARTAAVLAVAVLAAAVLAATAEPARADGDPQAGAKVFRACAVCHSVEEGKRTIGPNLRRVIGRTPGTEAGFAYSDAMKAFGAGGSTWNETTLDTYLANPREVVAGTRMGFPGLKAAADRENLIAYLKSLSR